MATTEQNTSSMASPGSSAASPPTTSHLFAGGLQPLSCVRCAHRKVKCNRKSPCENCAKQSVPCEFPPPRTEKRKRRKPAAVPSSNELQAKLDRYEDILKGFGVDVEQAANGAEVITQTPRHEEQPRGTKDPTEQGRLLVNGKRSRYVQGNIWAKINSVSENPNGLLPDSSEDESDDESIDAFDPAKHAIGGLPIGTSLHRARIAELFPTQEHFIKLWQAFVANVHPLTMLIHVPSATEMITQASKGHGWAPRDAEALMFAVLAMAVVSLPEADCMQQFGQKKSSMLARYRVATELALINAKYLVSSKLSVLQALTFYLLALQLDVDPRALWNLTGIAKRNAQRLGLFQPSAKDGLSPFELEMRLRLSHLIFMYDAILSQTAGTSSSRDMSIIAFDAPAPLNVNESDLSPNMKEAPPERTGATDVIFCRLRYKMFTFMVKLNSGKNGRDVNNSNDHAMLDLSEQSTREKLIAETEKEIELEILRYCDLLNPVHHLVASTARLTLCKMRFWICHPRQNNGSLQQLSQEDRDSLFFTTLRVLEYGNSAQATPALQGFSWHSHQYFPWSCFVHVLDDLKTRTQGPDCDKAWEQVRLSYLYAADLSLEKKPRLRLQAAVNKLTVSSWAAREKAAAERGERLTTPSYVVALRRQAELAEKRRYNPSQVTSASSTYQSPGTPRGVAGYDFTDVSNVDPADIVNQGWPEFSGTPGSGFDGVDWGLFDALMKQ